MRDSKSGLRNAGQRAIRRCEMTEERGLLDRLKDGKTLDGFAADECARRLVGAGADVV